MMHLRRACDAGPYEQRQSWRGNRARFYQYRHGATAHVVAHSVNPCDPARLFGWSRAPPLPWAARCVCDYKRYCGISQWGQGLASPAFAAAANPKIFPRTVGGPAVQAPTSKGQSFHKNISLFCDSIVGASIARPPLPQLQPKKYPPYRWRACNAGPYKQ